MRYFIFSFLGESIKADVDFILTEHLISDQFTFQVINSHLRLMKTIQESKYVGHLYPSFEKLNTIFFPS